MDTAPLRELQEKIAETWQLLRLDETKQRILDLEAQVAEPTFWNNQERARGVSQELSGLQEEVARWEGIKREVDETLELAGIAEKEGDTAMEAELAGKATELQQRFAELEFFIMLSGEYDANDAIVAFHAGAGGVDAQDWAEMLLRMILRFSEQQGWQTEILAISSGGEAGIKSATVSVRGRYAYGYLKSENGVHRLVRISPYDAEQMRHTSFALIEVIPDLGEIAEVEIDDKDLKIEVFRAGGHGGQSVNTTDSAVRITHVPTGITVSCQNERSQHQNKATAMKILKSKLHQRYLAEQQAEKKKLRGEFASAEWGSQIRSYVLHPYKLVKDHRTEYEVTNPDAVLNGDLKGFMEAYLRWQQGEERAA
jgi:peptide chain release factor 2